MAFDLQIAALTIYAEASSGSHDERSAVAHVIWNRVQSKRWSPTIAGVCTDYLQFSSWNGDKGDRHNLQRAMNAVDSDPIMADCLGAIAAAKGGWPDPTKGSTHYTDKSIDPPSWTVGAVLALETEKFRFYSGVK